MTIPRSKALYTVGSLRTEDIHEAMRYLIAEWRAGRPASLITSSLEILAYSGRGRPR